MEALIDEDSAVRVRKIDIDSWSSPVARGYRIESIPQLWLHQGLELKTKSRAKVMEALDVFRD